MTARCEGEGERGQHLADVDDGAADADDYADPATIAAAAAAHSAPEPAFTPAPAPV